MLTKEQAMRAVRNLKEGAYGAEQVEEIGRLLVEAVDGDAITWDELGVTRATLEETCGSALI